MTLQPAAQPRPSPERVQREHELNTALEAARRLQARLELLGDRQLDVAVVVSLRHSLTRDLVKTTPPYSAFRRNDDEPSSFPDAPPQAERLRAGDRRPGGPER